ncbi:MAG: beta-ketoacyl synthase N-terminal-like domain-containing protein [Sulfuricurvum sp.]|uniref:beta-ketoacyl-[acyl-carrier-protein] synthase family protein n=1 Tax=Sulfuricurvum sp. TaxID=2025608 RepID=UPI0026137141|nr:beta-ketoacyl synthase N-terminal-like domain-containing protein [Sulfuricurvum sp.]MDD2829462.1 beta-ketoacyl synthase N-terminal-like domain-containing protein [Sulfuricurvum sp.]MDD4948455.1 beta-ketoacyl synthase N-terminal-like domain-containing protein [Sulfuricurvum sp.]
MRRVVITGVGFYSPIGESMVELRQSFEEMKSGIRYMGEWEGANGLEARIAGVVPANDFSEIPRANRRTMDRVAMMCALSLKRAIAQSGLGEEVIQSPRTGLSFGSAMGGLETLFEYAEDVSHNDGFGRQNATAFLRFMSHTVAANLAVMFGIIGRNIPTCSACTASAQAIGAGYESIKYGMSDVMFVGGGEGLHYVEAGIFDSMGATAIGYNDNAEAASRPFDQSRSGLVVAEGSGALVLEEYEHAKARGAIILGEIVGYATGCDGNHITLPSQAGMEQVMRDALRDANMNPDEIGYINAHATATPKGDIFESMAVHNLFGSTTPISSIKGYTGHMFGGGGAFETIVTLMAINESFLPANKNLEEIDPDCAPLDYIQTHRHMQIGAAMNNNFAFGGINTSIILKKFQE